MTRYASHYIQNLVRLCKYDLSCYHGKYIVGYQHRKRSELRPRVDDTSPIAVLLVFINGTVEIDDTSSY
jgi:hypothetical protein